MEDANTGSVLTYYTDDFIVGDRVWVNGTKPGHIVYIGETHFAPGEWAGVVLDDPIGKNDGRVGHKRYFYCGPNRGIFSRLWRLTRRPLIPYEYQYDELLRRPYSSLYRPTSALSSTHSSRARSASPTRYRTRYLRPLSPERKTIVTTTFLRDGYPIRTYSRSESPVKSTTRVSFEDKGRDTDPYGKTTESARRWMKHDSTETSYRSTIA